MGNFLIILQFYLVINPSRSTAVSDAEFYTEQKMVHTLNNDLFSPTKNGCPTLFANLLFYIRLSERGIKSKFEREGGKSWSCWGGFTGFCFSFLHVINKPWKLELHWNKVLTYEQYG